MIRASFCLPWGAWEIRVYEASYALTFPHSFGWGLVSSSSSIESKQLTTVGSYPQYMIVAILQENLRSCEVFLPPVLVWLIDGVFFFHWFIEVNGQFFMCRNYHHQVFHMIWNCEADCKSEPSQGHAIKTQNSMIEEHRLSIDCSKVFVGCSLSILRLPATAVLHYSGWSSNAYFDRGFPP